MADSEFFFQRGSEPPTRKLNNQKKRKGKGQFWFTVDILSILLLCKRCSFHRSIKTQSSALLTGSGVLPQENCS